MIRLEDEVLGFTYKLDYNIEAWSEMDRREGKRETKET